MIVPFERNMGVQVRTPIPNWQEIRKITFKNRGITLYPKDLGTNYAVTVFWQSNKKEWTILKHHPNPTNRDPSYIGGGGFKDLYRAVDLETGKLYARGEYHNAETELFHEEGNSDEDLTRIRKRRRDSYRDFSGDRYFCGGDSFITKTLEGDRFVVITPLINGGDLFDWEKKHQNDSDESKVEALEKISRQVVKILKRLACSGWTHKDIQYGNLLVDTYDNGRIKRLKLTDFDLSEPVDLSKPFEEDVHDAGNMINSLAGHLFPCVGLLKPELNKVKKRVDELLNYSEKEELPISLRNTKRINLVKETTPSKELLEESLKKIKFLRCI